MNEKVKQAFKLLCEQYVKDLNKYENKEIDKDYFYNPKYECGFKIDGKNVYFADILKAFDSMEELIKGKDEYIAKLCNDIAELKEHEKELIAEQHRLFDLAKEQETEIKTLIDKNEEMSTDRNKARNENFKLKEFMRIVFEKNVFIWGMVYRKKELKDYEPTYEYYKNHCGYFHSGYSWKLMTETEFDLVKKVVEKYGQ